MSKENPVYSFRKRAAAQLLPAISSSDNKAQRGRSLILAGSKAYPGAGVLAALAALRMGSGYVTLGQPEIAVSSLENPDFLICNLSKEKLENLKFDAILVGPGFGVNSYTASVIRWLKEHRLERVVLDADALTVCAQEQLFPLPPTWIVTPHTGELARCLGVTSEEINHNRLFFLNEARRYMGCVVLLKGHRTLVRGEVKTYRIMSGNSALAKSGTGDVLAGIITSLRTQGLPPVQAALLGAYLHGACGNLWVAQGKDELSMLASDILRLLPSVIYQLRRI